MESISKIMIKKGDTITCVETLEVNGDTYFIQGHAYISSMDNCLLSRRGEVFIQQQYLKHFVFKIETPIQENNNQQPIKPEYKYLKEYDDLVWRLNLTTGLMLPNDKWVFLQKLRDEIILEMYKLEK